MGDGPYVLPRAGGHAPGELPAALRAAATIWLGLMGLVAVFGVLTTSMRVGRWAGNWLGILHASSSAGQTDSIVHLTHQGLAVMLGAVSVVVLGWIIAQARGAARVLAALSLAGIVAQALLGMYRTLIAGPDHLHAGETIALVHGAIAAGTIALGSALLVTLHPAFASSNLPDWMHGERAWRRAKALAVALLLGLIVQGTLGAMYSLLTAHKMILIHIAFSVIIFALAMATGSTCAARAAGLPHPVRTVGRLLRIVVVLQVVLGVVAIMWPWANQTVGASVFRMLHGVNAAVLVGLAGAAVAWMMRLEPGPAARA
jgi:hypothetical protein